MHTLIYIKLYGKDVKSLYSIVQAIQNITEDMKMSLTLANTQL